DTCDGSSNACPDVKRPSGFTCRASADLCDVADTCDGSSNACLDVKRPNGFTCRASADVCDGDDTCDGTSNACVDVKRPNGFTCRASAGACDLADICDGTSIACPDKFAAANTTCPSGGTCQLLGTCSGSSAACTPNPGCGKDTKPPEWSNVPNTIVAYATGTSGACVNYTKPTATDAVDGVRPVTCTPASGSTFKLNQTKVKCTASDKSGN